MTSRLKKFEKKDNAESFWDLETCFFKQNSCSYWKYNLVIDWWEVGNMNSHNEHNFFLF